MTPSSSPAAMAFLVPVVVVIMMAILGLHEDSLCVAEVVFPYPSSFTQCHVDNDISFPVSEFNYDFELLGEAYRVDTSSDYLFAGSSSGKWRNAVVAQNGLVYCVPNSASTVLVIDPATNEVDYTSISVVRTGGSPWFSVVAPDNGKLYFIPVNADNVVILDTTNNNAVDQTTIAGLGDDVNKWQGAAIAPSNGKIYCPPLAATVVLIIDPADDSFDTTTITGLPPSTGSGKWIGALVSPSGLIYSIPYDSDNVLIINPMMDTADFTSVSVSSEATVNRWIGGSITPAGKIYGIPSADDRILVIDTMNGDAVSYISITVPDGTFAWIGSVITSTGKIVGIPRDAPAALVIDPDTDEVDTTTLVAEGSSTLKWVGGVYVPEYNRIYGVPLGHTHVLQMDLNPCPFEAVTCSSIDVTSIVDCTDLCTGDFSESEEGRSCVCLDGGQCVDVPGEEPTEVSFEFTCRKDLRGYNPMRRENFFNTFFTRLQQACGGDLITPIATIYTGARSVTVQVSEQEARTIYTCGSDLVTTFRTNKCRVRSYEVHNLKANDEDTFQSVVRVHTRVKTRRKLDDYSEEHAVRRYARIFALALYKNCAIDPDNLVSEGRRSFCVVDENSFEVAVRDAEVVDDILECVYTHRLKFRGVVLNSGSDASNTSTCIQPSTTTTTATTEPTTTTGLPE